MPELRATFNATPDGVMTNEVGVINVFERLTA